MPVSPAIRWFALAALGLAVAAVVASGPNETNAAAVRPAIDQATVATYVGGSVALTGTGLGNAPSSRTLLLTESGLTPAALSAESALVQVWQDDLVEFSLPDGWQSGNLTVVVDGLTSEPVELLVFEYESIDLPATSGTNEQALALAMAPNGALWINEEFHLQLKALTPGPPGAARAFSIPQAAGPGIFAQRFMGDGQTRISTLGEDGAQQSRVIVLGDSIAAGCCIGGAPGWAPQLAAQLDAQLESVAIPGARSESLINQPVSWPSGNNHSQLDEALFFLDAAPDSGVRAVAMGIGVNDWFRYRDPATNVRCIDMPTTGCDALVDQTMVLYRSNLHTILTELQAHMKPGTPLLIMTYYGLPYEYGLQEMNAVIEEEAAELGVTVVDMEANFEGRLDELVGADRLHASAAGHDLMADLFTNAVPPDGDADGLSDAMEVVLGTEMSNPDTDGDGCTDGEEFAPDASLGGQRDPNNPWDFYDVPTMDGGPDGDIALLTDLLGLLRRLGSNDRNGLAAVNRYSDPALPLADQTSYHPAFDRSRPPEGAPRYAMGPPDGRIDFVDLLGMVWQYGHRC